MMDTVKRICGWLLILTVVITAAHFLIEPFYANSLQVWGYINFLIAAAMILTLAFNYQRWRSDSGGDKDAPPTRAYIESSALLYASVFIAILFFYNWFGRLSPVPEVEPAGWVWILVDALAVIIYGATGIRLQQPGSDSS